MILQILSNYVDLWPSWRLIHAMDVLFVFGIYFSVGLYSQIQIFMSFQWRIQ